MSNDLFAPRVPEEVAAKRPLADRLRPKTLADVTGQEHLTGDIGERLRPQPVGKRPQIGRASCRERV